MDGTGLYVGLLSVTLGPTSECYVTCGTTFCSIREPCRWMWNYFLLASEGHPHGCDGAMWDCFLKH